MHLAVNSPAVRDAARYKDMCAVCLAARRKRVGAAGHMDTRWDMCSTLCKCCGELHDICVTLYYQRRWCQTRGCQCEICERCYRMRK
jgi:hypothetical protein